VEPPQVPLVQAYAVTARDWLPDSSQTSLNPPQEPQAPTPVVPQVVPSGMAAFPGQLGLEPVQFSTASQVPEAERHSVPEGE
jgi:hypothetical protein